MDLQSTILQSLGKDVMQSIGEKTNTDPESVEKIVKTGLPIMLGTLGKNASDEKGAADLSNALDDKHDGSLLDSLGDIFSSGQDANVDGLKILGHMFGPNENATEEKLAKKTGFDAGTIAKVLSFVAPIVLAQLGKQKKESNLDSSGLTDLLSKQTTTSGNSVMDLATSFLDQDGDGQFVDDLFGMFAKGGK